MYIIYNRDGSIRKVNLTEFINQGNDGVNKIYVSVDGLSHAQYNVTVVFRLATGEKVEVVATAVDSFKDVEDNEYTNGYEIELAEVVTQYEGILLASVVAIDLLTNRLYTYPMKLTINGTTFEPSEDVDINSYQYQNLLNYVKTTLNKAKDFVKVSIKNGTVTLDSDAVILIKLVGSKKSKLKSYPSSKLQLNKKGNWLCDRLINNPLAAGTYTFGEILSIILGESQLEWERDSIQNNYQALDDEKPFGYKFLDDESQKYYYYDTFGIGDQEFYLDVSSLSSNRQFIKKMLCGSGNINMGGYFYWHYNFTIRFVKNFTLRGEDKTKGWKGQMSNYQIKYFVSVADSHNGLYFVVQNNG